jgi:hypothetical protein
MKLKDRIDELERKIRELEARPPVVITLPPVVITAPPPQPIPWYPPFQPWYMQPCLPWYGYITRGSDDAFAGQAATPTYPDFNQTSPATFGLVS